MVCAGFRILPGGHNLCSPDGRSDVATSAPTAALRGRPCLGACSVGEATEGRGAGGPSAALESLPQTGLPEKVPQGGSEGEGREQGGPSCRGRDLHQGPQGSHSGAHSGAHLRHRLQRGAEPRNQEGVVVSLLREPAARSQPLPRRALMGFLACARPWTVSETRAGSDHSVPSLRGSSSSDALGWDSGNTNSNQLKK